jgi:hypothetical protein
MKLIKLIIKYCIISIFIGTIAYIPAFFIPSSQTFVLISNYILFFYPVILTIVCIKDFKIRKLLKRERFLISFSLTIITTLTIMVIGTLNLAGYHLNETEENMGGPVGIGLHFGLIIFVFTTVAGLVIKNKPAVRICNPDL